MLFHIPRASRESRIPGEISTATQPRDLGTSPRKTLQSPLNSGVYNINTPGESGAQSVPNPSAVGRGSFGDPSERNFEEWQESPARLGVASLSSLPVESAVPSCPRYAPLIRVPGDRGAERLSALGTLSRGTEQRRGKDSTRSWTELSRSPGGARKSTLAVSWPRRD